MLQIVWKHITTYIGLWWPMMGFVCDVIRFHVKNKLLLRYTTLSLACSVCCCSDSHISTGITWLFHSARLDHKFWHIHCAITCLAILYYHVSGLSVECKCWLVVTIMQSPCWMYHVAMEITHHQHPTATWLRYATQNNLNCVGLSSTSKNSLKPPLRTSTVSTVVCNGKRQWNEPFVYLSAWQATE